MSSFDGNSNEGKIKPIKYWDSETVEHPATTLNPNPNFWKNTKFTEKQRTLLLFWCHTNKWPFILKLSQILPQP